jgi:murein DD-endopeptidase MepM/ murein hydrolase activator NlpD
MHRSRRPYWFGARVFRTLAGGLLTTLALLAVALVAVAYLAVAGLAGADSEAPFRPGKTRVGPAYPLFDGPRNVSLRYRFGGTEPLDIRIRVIRAANGRTAQTWVERDREPGVRHRRRWNGIDGRGKAARGGRYRFRLAPLGSTREWQVGSFVLRDHVYPVGGPHSRRGAIGEFGAPRSGGRTHEGFDVLADCGTPLRAARGGRVQRAGYDDVLYGWYVLIDGRKTGRDYFYSHLLRNHHLGKGDRIRTGERIGEVGRTGNARATPCHLHFELRGRDGPIDPKPSLRRWDRWS